MIALLAGCADDNTSPGAAIEGPLTTTTPVVVEQAECDFGEPVRVLDGTSLCKISGTITENVTLTSDTYWILSGGVFVGEDGSEQEVTLTIEPGTMLAGESGNDFLVINRGAKIEAAGTRSEPIVMTSIADLEGEAEENDRGEWGGLIINGKAPINGCNADETLCEAEGEGGTGKYGGNDVADNSGTLRYLQVKYAGFEITEKNELNGIAFQGVGSGTTVEYIQVHNNDDDGVEFFGGTVNAKYLVLTGNEDDSLDWTLGWQGKVQYVLIKQAEDAGDQGIEADNNGDANDAEPRSHPTLSNMTIIGNVNTDVGILLREGTAATIYNTIVSGFGEACIDIDNAATFNLAGAPIPADVLSLAGEEGARFDLSDSQLIMENSLIQCVAGGEDVSIKDSEIEGDAPDTVNDPWLVSDWFGAHRYNQVASAQLIDFISVPNSLAFPPEGIDEEGLKAFQNTPIADGFIEETAYIGAFASNDEDDDWTRGWTFGLHAEEAVSTDCPAGTVLNEIATNAVGKTTCQLLGNYTQDLTLTNDIDWVLVGGVFIGGDNTLSTELKIEAGTRIYGREGRDFLVINRGSQIFAEGTADQPIIMTSASDVAGDAGDTTRGEWGGLIINGNAPINGCLAGEVCEAEGEGSTGTYGGDDAEDDSGVLRYVQLRYAGFEISPDNELNGIAFQGVGSGTTVEYIQVHNNADDGVEFFGGTVNAKYVVLTGIRDDSLDWTLGWKGKAQYVLVRQADDAGDQGIEADNNGSANDSLPRAQPQLANMTLIGSANADVGILLREGTGANIYNTIVEGFGDACIDIDNPATFANAGADIPGVIAANNLTMVNSMVSCPDSVEFKDGETENAGEADEFNDPWLVSDWFNGQTENQVIAPELVEYIYAATSAAAVSADLSGDDFFDDVDYIGAVAEGDDWTEGWTIGL